MRRVRPAAWASADGRLREYGFARPLPPRPRPLSVALIFHHASSTRLSWSSCVSFPALCLFLTSTELTRCLLGSAPPSLAELGRSTWTFLHSVAAYYPPQPTEAHQNAARALVGSVATLFPCRTCADDWARILSERPPRTESDRAFSQWMCEAHNEVNATLGKDEFDCSQVDHRWKRQGKHVD